MLQKTNNPAFALTIAGSDSGGGAGIQADLKAFAATGAFGLSAITAITAQNTQTVSAVYPAGRDAVRAQLQALAIDFAIGAAKTGMLVDAPTVREATAFFQGRRIPLIVDPVMIATSGAALLQADAIDAYSALIEQAELITPNLPEAQALLQCDAISSKKHMQLAAKRLLKLGAKAVLLKGGHGQDARCWDLLMISTTSGASHRWFASRRLDLRGHGTGCTLSALITGHRACGIDLESAVSLAIKMLQRALRGMPAIGQAKATTPDPFFARYR